jgi:hypothetical protein
VFRQAHTRIWLLPLSIVAGASLSVFVLSYWIDASLSANPVHALSLVFHPNPQAAATTLSNAAEVTAAVLGVALTVVAIVVELASNRYTHRVTELFVSEPRNFMVMGLFVVTALQGMWVSLTFDYDPAHGGFVPYTGIALAMSLLTLCLLVLLPYFNFVFAFLNPIQIVGRINKHTLAAIERAGKHVELAQGEAVRGIDQIGDVALNAMQSSDKGVSISAVDALRSLWTGYQRARPRLPDAWFQVGGELAHNADFVSMDPGVLADLGERRVWLEMKILRQYQTVFGEALGRVRDVAYVVAINTRLMAEEAARAGNEALLRLAVKFFNTYLRAAISSADVRTAYSVSHQYRLLAQTLLDRNERALVIEIAHHLHYYGQVAYAAQLPFILETVAYDLCTLNEVAHARGDAALDELLHVFLTVDKEGDGEVHEASLRGVRKAQIKLATYFLLQGDEPRARRIQLDMASEDRARLASIHDELLRVDSADYWEITDRGVNFDYLTPERKQKLAVFFGWF